MSETNRVLTKDVLVLDAAAEVERIAASLREALSATLKRRGLVVAISGGVDSAVCAALSVRAVGASKVFGLLLPERDSSSSSSTRGRMVAEQLGIEFLTHDIAPTLEAIGCYRWRDEAMSRVFPDYSPAWKSKIAIESGVDHRFSFFRLVVQSPEGTVHEARMPLKEYLQVVAATNFKQRVRKTVEYFHADRLHYAVVGTPNRLEFDQGFFVKNGDGSADVKPIAHLYKTQVYQLARFLGIPAEICEAPPTTDTFSLPQGQDEFYFSLPYDKMDVALWAHNHGKSAEELASVLGISMTQAQHVYSDIETKRKTTRYLHSKALLVSPVSEVQPLG